MTLLTHGIVWLYLLQFGAQARAQLAAIANGYRERTGLLTSPIFTQDWKDSAVVSLNTPDALSPQ